MSIKNLIIDTDPGVDDAMTILLAMASPEIENLMITAVHGNVGVNQTFANAQALVNLQPERNIPVFKGAAKPLTRQTLAQADHVHGGDGMHGLTLPIHQATTPSTNAAAAIIEKINNTSEPVTIVTIGALTNLAAALIQDPSIAGKIDQLIVMGGAFARDDMNLNKGGNITPYAEFNIYTDPDAAALVFSNFPKIVMYPLNLTHQVLLTPAFREELAGRDHPLGAQLAAMLDKYAAQYVTFNDPSVPAGTCPLHDANTVIGLLRPDFYKQALQGRVSVETALPRTLGQTIFTPDPQGNVRVVTGGDDEAILAFAQARLRDFTLSLA